jgi:hypothetical protein
MRTYLLLALLLVGCGDDAASSAPPGPVAAPEDGGAVINGGGAGASCLKTTCQDRGATCGEISDGCGGTLSCGTCDGYWVCGASGLANVCAPPCPSKCPQGYRCDLSGACIDGSPGALALEVESIAVSGAVTFNGEQPNAACVDGRRGTLLFENSSKGYKFDVPIPCGSGPLRYSARLFPALYAVTFTATPGSDVPTIPYAFSRSADLAADTADLTFDVATPSVGGTVTMDGAIPTAACVNDRRGMLSFENRITGYTSEVPIPCGDAGSPLAFRQKLYAGEYRVTFRSTPGSSLPSPPYTLDSGLQIQASVDNLQFDVPTQMASGTVTLAGAAPTSDCATSGNADRATVLLSSYSLGSFELPVPCNGGASPVAFSGRVYRGYYRATIRGGASSIPSQPYEVPAEISVPSSAPIVLDIPLSTVAGEVTVAKAPPTGPCGGVVTFRDSWARAEFKLPIVCSGGVPPFTFGGQIYSGSYQAWVNGLPGSNLPLTPRQVEGINSMSDMAHLKLDVSDYAVSGKVTLNGVDPTSECTTEDRAVVSFSHYDSPPYEIPIPCNGASGPFLYSTRLPPGYYQVSVTGGSSNLPPYPSSVTSFFVDEADKTNVDLDVRTFKVSGTITMDGKAPGGACSGKRGTVTFRQQYSAKEREVTVPCGAAGAPFTFETWLDPGVYEVRVKGESSDLPSVPYLLDAALSVTVNRSFTGDVVTRAVAGTVTSRGSAPAFVCSADTPVRVLFTDSVGGYRFELPVTCGSPPSFSGRVYPGSYLIRAGNVGKEGVAVQRLKIVP